MLWLYVPNECPLLTLVCIGWFGQNCTQDCGNCANGTCDPILGMCSSEGCGTNSDYRLDNMCFKCPFLLCNQEQSHNVESECKESI